MRTDSLFDTLFVNVFCAIVLPLTQGDTEYYRLFMMKFYRKNFSHLKQTIVLSVGALFLFSTVPFPAFADVISVQTQQILPPGPNTCVPLNVINFTSYIYDGSVDSFDLSVSDASYVSLVASVGETSIPFQFMNRHIDPSSGILRIHVDIASTPVPDATPIVMTLVSAKGPGQPVCAAIVSFTLTDKSGVSPPIVQSTQEPFHAIQTPSSEPQNSTKVPVKSPVDQPATTSTSSLTKSSGSPVMSLSAQIKNTINRTCAVPGGSLRLWSVLLAIYVLIIAAAILSQPSFMPTIASAIGMWIAVLLPLLFILTLWRTSSACQIGTWVPISALFIGALGALIGFREHPSFQNFIQTFSLPPEN